MREITTQQLFQVLSSFQGKKVEVSITPSLARTTNTYSKFALTESIDTLFLYNYDTQITQELEIIKDSISNIVYTEGQNYFESTISIYLKDNTIIDLCVSEEAEVCAKCGKVINVSPIATVWKIEGVGGYTSHFDNEKLSLAICDDCLYYDILGYKDGQFDGIEEENYYNLTMH